MATYKVNGRGQRISKTVAGTTTRFVYDDQGRLLGEYDHAGKLIQETIWLEDLPIATLRPTGASGTPTPVNIYHVHPDHLGSPRAITRPSDNAFVWRWDNVDPFGANAANENPAGLGTFRYALRFPGQYYDAESGTHYNYFRDYDPTVGRYVESDPIGLRGGVNTYSYVHGSPIRYGDPFGLDIRVCFYKDAAAGLGHIGYGLPGEVGTTGFYPYIDGLTGLIGPGVIDRDNKHQPTSCKTLPSGPEQDECMADCRKRRTFDSGKYNLALRQCTDFVRTCLAQCGLGNYGGGPFPKGLFDRLPPVGPQ